MDGDSVSTNKLHVSGLSERVCFLSVYNGEGEIRVYGSMIGFVWGGW